MCGHCMINTVCDKGTGRCPNGCQAQWTGEKCDGRFLDMPNVLQLFFKFMVQVFPVYAHTFKHAQLDPFAINGFD